MKNKDYANTDVKKSQTGEGGRSVGRTVDLFQSLASNSFYWPIRLVACDQILRGKVCCLRDQTDRAIIF